MTEKIKKASLDAVIASAEELFSDSDTKPLAMAAGIIGSSASDTLADAVDALQKIILKSAHKANSTEEYNKLVRKSLAKSTRFERLYDSLQFLAKFAGRAATSAAQEVVNQPDRDTEPTPRFDLN